MGRRLKRAAAALLAIVMLAAFSLTSLAANRVDSSGALLYANGQTAYYVSPEGRLLLSGMNPIDGNTYREFIDIGVSVQPKASMLAAGEDFIAYVDPNGGFGLLQRFYVGDENPLAAAPKQGAPVQMVAAGSGHLMVLTDMGEVKVYGRNDYGQLGSADGGYVMDARYIAGGADSAFAIDEDNNLYAWGRNHVGQLGVGDKVDRYEPAFVLSNVKNVWTSGGHTFARTFNGVLYGWGSNTSGQLGFANMKNNILSPQKLGSKYVDVAPGVRHTLFFDKYGNVYGCGSNQNYELGLKSRETQNKIVDLKRTAQALAAGDGFSLIVTQKDGTFAGSGRNDNGQLGLVSKRTFAEGFTRLTLPDVASQMHSVVNPLASAYLVGIVEEVDHSDGVVAGMFLRATEGAYTGQIYVPVPPEIQQVNLLFVTGDRVRVDFSGAMTRSIPPRALDVSRIEYASLDRN